MGVHNIRLVVYSKISGSGDLNLDLSELLSDSCATRVEVVVHVFNVENDEFGHSLTTKACSETVFPEVHFVNFKCLHGLAVDNVHELRDFIDQDQRADSSVKLGSGLW